MTVLDILASTEIHSLARGCAFSYRLSHIIYYGVMGGGRIIKIVNTSAVHLLLKRGGLIFEGGVFPGEYGNITCQ